MAEISIDSFHRQQMQLLFDSGQFSDVTLVVGQPGEEQKEFKVHRNLLSSFSPVFAAMFSHTETKEALEKRVVIEDVSAEAMKRLLTFIYTGERKYDKKEGPLLEFLAAVDKYQVDLLKAECVSHLSDLVTVDSVCNILLSADLHNASALKEQCLDFIVRNSDQIITCNNKTWLQFEEIARMELIKKLLYRLAAKKCTCAFQNSMPFQSIDSDSSDYSRY